MDCQAQAVRPFSPSFKAVVEPSLAWPRYPAGPRAWRKLLIPCVQNFRSSGDSVPTALPVRKAPGFFCTGLVLAGDVG